MLQNTCSRLRLNANQWTSGSKVGVSGDDGGQGDVTVCSCSWVLGSGLRVVDHLAHNCFDNGVLEALPTGTYHHFGFVGCDQAVISQKLPVGKLVDS